MNKIIIIGNLTGDPAIRTTRDGNARRRPISSCAALGAM